MKTKIFLLICTLFIFVNCNKKELTKDENDAITKLKLETKGKKINPDDIKNCDDFINSYEAWTDDFIKIMEKHKGDPVAIATSSEYINTMMKGMDFLKDWKTISMSCATDKSYAKRMKAIQNKLKKRKEALGM